jgi:hypothetical protein
MLASPVKQQLPDGRWFYFDEVDAELVASYKWHDQKGYVSTEVGRRELGTRKHLLLHRLIMAVGPEQKVDHRDRNPLNNCRSNLRVATKVENARNRSAQRNNKSGLKGVSFVKKTGRWRATINVDGRQQGLGSFVTPEEAHEAYVLAAKRLHGEFACG